MPLPYREHAAIIKVHEVGVLSVGCKVLGHKVWDTKDKGAYCECAKCWGTKYGVYKVCITGKYC